MAASPDSQFVCEVEESQAQEAKKITTVRLRGRLVSTTAEQFKNTTRPLVVRGSHIVIDFSDLAYLDSSGLGAVVGLKVSSMSKGECTLELVNLSPRVRELLKLANLTQFFSIKPYPGSGSAFAYHAEVHGDPEREQTSEKK